MPAVILFGKGFQRINAGDLTIRFPPGFDAQCFLCRPSIIAFPRLQYVILLK